MIFTRMYFTHHTAYFHTQSAAFMNLNYIFTHIDYEKLTTHSVPTRFLSKMCTSVIKINGVRCKGIGTL